MVRSIPTAAIVLFALLAATFAAAQEPASTLDDFRKFFRKLEARADRVEAVLALERVEDPAVVDLLVPVLEDEDPEVFAAALRVLGGLKTDPPRLALAAALEKSKAPGQRAALLNAVAKIGLPFEGKLEKAIERSLSDKNWSVRLAAVDAAVGLGGSAAVGRVLPLAADAEPAVRAGALDALSARRLREVVEPALAALVDPVWQVRLAAIEALTRVRDVRAVPALIERLSREEGRLAVDAAAALDALTGRSYGLDVDGWRRFWDTFGARYQLPTDDELERLRVARAANAARYSPPGATSYHGIETPSRAIVFVIDVSGSMETHVVQKERFAEGNYPSFSRIDIVKTELMRTIERLEPHVRFNMLAFATDVAPWRKEMVPASGLYKKSALDWIERLKPLGTREDIALVSAGLAGASNLGAGKTNTHGAIMAALGVPVGSKAAAQTGAYQVETDTIFFLSDGQPTHGEFIEEADVLRVVRENNALRRIAIHTIAIGDFSDQLMKRLAEENGGVFVNLGR